MLNSVEILTSISRQKVAAYQKEALAQHLKPHSSVRQSLAKNLRQWADKLEPKAIQKTEVYS